MVRYAEHRIAPRTSHLDVRNIHDMRGALFACLYTRARTYLHTYAATCACARVLNVTHTNTCP